MSTLPLNDKVALLESNRTWSDISEVARAVCEVSNRPGRVYVERLGERYRWSLSHKGGVYPLVRTTATWLGVDYQSIYLGFATLPDGTAIIRDHTQTNETPDTWALLEFGSLRGVGAIEEILQFELR